MPIFNYYVKRLIFAVFLIDIIAFPRWNQSHFGTVAWTEIR